MPIRRATFAHLVIAVSILVVSGCSDDGLVPISGQVLFKGKPLEFGSVMLQPVVGPPSSGVIQPDGSFELETHGVGVGASPGPNRVRVTCFESQRPGASSGSGVELALGRSLIPERYTNFTSGLVVEIKPDHDEPLVIKLTD